MVTRRGSSSRRLIGFGLGPAPPKVVLVSSAVRRNPSNWRGEFFPHGAGSRLRSSSSNTLKLVSRASAFRVEMVWYSAITSAVATAAPPAINPAHSAARDLAGPVLPLIAHPPRLKSDAVEFSSRAQS